MRRTVAFVVLSCASVAIGGSDALARPATPTPTPTASPNPFPSFGGSAGGAGVAGDCDANGSVRVDDLIRGVGIILGDLPLASCTALDSDGNGRVTIDELIRAVRIALGDPPATARPSPTPTRTIGAAGLLLLSSSPEQGEGGVAITRETILRFSGPLDPDTVTPESLHADFAGGRLVARFHFSPDRNTLSLFYDVALPAGSRIRLTIDGEGIRGADGSAVDADRDGRPGGVGRIDFDTLAIATVPGTAVCGRIFASELVPGDNAESINVPLEGVTIFVDGMEDWHAVTDRNGDFRLEPAPAGRFFVFIKGTTATNEVPAGAYYPNVGKSWNSVAGVETNIGEIYLPLIGAGTLQPVSSTQETEIRFPAPVRQDFPDLADVRLTVPADALFADDGSRGGMVGIAPVAPDRIPSRLPPGLAFPLVITVQTDGPENFDLPVPACFPNSPDPRSGAPLAPGTESALWSFNHDTGEFEVIGAMRVTADGRLVCTDPGVGILAPGWHGSAPGVAGSGGPILGGGPCPGCEPPPPCPVCEPVPCPTCNGCCQGCGDGLHCPNCGEECDDGNNLPGDSCLPGCKLPCSDPGSGGCPTSPCLSSSCNPETGSCDSAPLSAGTPCDDSNPCTGAGQCNATGSCQAQPLTDGTPCPPPNPCLSGTACQGGSCQGGTPLPDGTACEQPCLAGGSCANGSCQGTAAACCGDGFVDPGEQCDDGTLNSDTQPNACRTNCTLAFCGDGVLDAESTIGVEECDLGEEANTGAPGVCRPNCKLPKCGDLIVDTALGELCDLANDNSFTPNTCRPDCTFPKCGDGILDTDFEESCDAGTFNSNTLPDACRENCKLPFCGDGVVDTNQQCDDGNTQNGDGCNNDCVIECGNGELDPGEQCDDGNTADDATCRPDCSGVPACGDGILDAVIGEQCDDGTANAAAPNACRPTCAIPPCGDGIIDDQYGEACDDGNASAGDGCGASCQTETCGNFIIDPGEQCDDGNTVDDPTCRGDCSGVPVCGDGILDPFAAELCDDGAANSDTTPDACRADCLAAGCGDAVLDSGEACDDGNTAGGDGCSGQCAPEPGLTPGCGNAVVEPNEQCDEGPGNSDTAPDACRIDCTLAQCGDGVVDTGEACDDGNTSDGDACPAGCGHGLLLEPRLIVGLGFCDTPGSRTIRVTTVPGGENVTTAEDVTYEWLGNGIAQGLVQTVIDELRQRAGIAAEIPIADIEIAGDQLVFKSTGINVLRARRGNLTSNFAFVIGELALIRAKSLEIAPVTVANTSVDLLTTLINKSLGDAGATMISLDQPMVLFRAGPLCSQSIDETLFGNGLVRVKKLGFELFGGRIEDIDLVETLSDLVDIAPAGTWKWVLRAIAIGGPVALSQALDFEVTTGTANAEKSEDAVIRIGQGWSFSATPPFVDDVTGLVRAKAPGVSAVKATLDLEEYCLGKAEDSMMVFVAPELEAVDVRAEDERVEEPLDVPFAPADRRVHLVGRFNLLAGAPNVIELDLTDTTPEEVQDLLAALLPGELSLAATLTLPPGAGTDPITGFYENGSELLALGLSSSLTASQFTLALTEATLQVRLPNLVTEWEVAPPPIAALDTSPSNLSFERQIVGLLPGFTDAVADACIPFLTPVTVSDLNGLVVRAGVCGDGNVDPGESCDDGNPIAGDGCEPDCSLPIPLPTPTPGFCGDGILYPPAEQCDDGNAIAGDGCEPDCTLSPGVFVPQAGELCITEVVTDPRRDWSDGSGAAGQQFDATPGPGSVAPDDPANEYLEIRNVGTRTLSLQSLEVLMIDAVPAAYHFGTATIEHYSPGATATIFPPGAIVVIGDPPGDLRNDVYVRLVGGGQFVIADLEIGGNFPSNNYESDDDFDGAVDEDGPGGGDDDGDLKVDEDGITPPHLGDPIADGAPGPGLNGLAAGLQDEALHRADDLADHRDYQRGAGTPGLGPTLGALLSIDEVVTRPLRDWNDSTGAVVAVFDRFPGPGSADDADEYVEIRNRGLATVSVRDLFLRMIDAAPVSYRLGSGVAGVVESYSPGSSADALQAGGIVVIGNPPGEMDDELFLALAVPCGRVLSKMEIGGNVAATNFEADDDRDGSVDEDPFNALDDDGDGLVDEDPFGPDPIGDGSLGADAGVTPLTEALRRVASSGVDAQDFVRGAGNPGASE